VSNTLLFAFKSDEVLVATPLQLYKIKYYHRNYRKQYANIRKLVVSGKIKNVADLIDYCKFRPGVNSQMYGLELLVTKLERHI